MPIARFQMPGGRVARFEVPDGTTPEQAQAMIASSLGQTKTPSTFDKVKQGAGDLVAGAIRGAGSIGATIVAPGDILNDAMNGKGLSLESNRQRRKDIDAGLQEMGANPDSWMYQGGKLGAEIAGTAGVPGMLAKGARAIPMLTKAVPNLPTALASGGFRVGQTATTLPGKLANAALRTGAGAAGGAAMSGLVNPDDMGTGAVVGGAMPGVFKGAGEAGKLVSDKVMRPVSRKLMQSALKPTIKQLKTGKAATAVDTLLDYGINPTQRGVKKLQGILDNINDQIDTSIVNSNAMVSKNDVLPYLHQNYRDAMSQVSPSADVNAISNVAEDFLSHPALPDELFPVQAAQNLKRGTYRAIKKSYGQRGAADIEAQKSLARGLKDNIAAKVPGISGLNAEEKRLLDTLDVAERRALMELNKNPFGLSLLAGSKEALIAFMADRSAAFKSLAARVVNRTSAIPRSVAPAVGLLENPALRAGLLATESSP